MSAVASLSICQRRYLLSQVACAAVGFVQTADNTAECCGLLGNLGCVPGGKTALNSSACR
jgi:hypothetical protein